MPVLAPVFFMSMDGRYIAKSQEGGANMSMDGRYIAKSQEGGANMYRMFIPQMNADKHR